MHQIQIDQKLLLALLGIPDHKLQPFPCDELIYADGFRQKLFDNDDFPELAGVHTFHHVCQNLFMTNTIRISRKIGPITRTGRYYWMMSVLKPDTRVALVYLDGCDLVGIT